MITWSQAKLYDPEGRWVHQTLNETFSPSDHRIDLILRSFYEPGQIENTVTVKFSSIEPLTATSINQHVV